MSISVVASPANDVEWPYTLNNFQSSLFLALKSSGNETQEELIL